MKTHYSEGSVFLVPLRGGGFATGVVARAAPRGGVLFGYFFGPRINSAKEQMMCNLDPSKAMLRIRFGDLGLLNYEWQVTGNIPNWDRSKWPMPQFIRRDPLGKRGARVVYYADDDPSCEVAEQPVNDCSGLMRDSLSGYGAVEIKLTKLLAS